MIKIPRWVSLIILFQLAACATSLDVQMQKSVGKPIDTIINSWGQPVSVTVGQNGYEIYYAWREEFCAKTFTTNKQGIITGWTNNGCPQF